jgi:hypothetical protein
MKTSALPEAKLCGLVGHISRVCPVERGELESPPLPEQFIKLASAYLFMVWLD